MKLALITPSFAPDFERCKLLCESVNDHVDPSMEHHLIVDRRDLSLFRSLENERTKIRTVEEIIPWWIIRLPWVRKWWLSLATKPVRNWILQQLVKLSVAEHVDAEGYVFVDSDVTFIRNFGPERLVKGDSLRLFRVPGAANLEGHRRWHRTSAQLLGLPPTDYFGSTYIGNQITWRRDNMKEMYRHIEGQTGRSWQAAIASSWHLSEYILYGIFVEHVLGGKGHHYEESPICHISWDYDLSSDEDINQFLSQIREYHSAVMVSAKQGFEPARYAHKLRQWEQSEKDRARLITA